MKHNILSTAGLRKAFTLIELLVVMIILAILAAVVIPRVLNRTEDAKVGAAITQLKNFDTALELFKVDTSSYPPSLDALIVNPGTGKWNGPYFKNADKIPLDPWGHPYIFKAPGDNNRDYDISSAGPDGQPATADDIQGWNIQKQ